MLSSSDLTYYKEGKTIMAGGYNIDEILKNEGRIPLEINTNLQMGGGGSNNGVPSGLFYLEQRIEQTYVPYSNQELISDDLYENLLSLMSSKESDIKKKRSIKKKKKNGKKLTKKNKK